MNIDTAIRILSEYVYEDKPCNVSHYDEATRLSIEALKRCQILSKNDTYWAARPLQGETKD